MGIFSGIAESGDGPERGVQKTENILDTFVLIISLFRFFAPAMAETCPSPKLHLRLKRVREP